MGSARVAASSILYRAIIAAILILLATPLTATAQPAGKIYRIGLLSAGSQAPGIEPFREGLRSLGYVEGQNIVIEHRSAEGRYDRLPDLAAELVKLRVDVIVAMVTQASLAAKNATRTIPIVMVGVADPVGAGLVPSLARPGGNVTGTSFPSVAVAGKSLEVLTRVVPKLQRVAVLWNPANPVFQAQMMKETEGAARSLGVQLRTHGARDANEIDGAFEAMAKERSEALIVIADALLLTHRTRIAALAVKNRLPSVSAVSEYAEAGGLMTYGPNWLEPGVRAAAQVDKILKGAKPADLPVEQATKYGLVLNLKTAKALGLRIPATLSAQADRIVE
jgi:putative ABC transport system substrate-binding protein